MGVPPGLAVAFGGQVSDQGCQQGLEHYVISLILHERAGGDMLVHTIA